MSDHHRQMLQIVHVFQKKVDRNYEHKKLTTAAGDMDAIQTLIKVVQDYRLYQTSRMWQFQNKNSKPQLSSQSSRSPHNPQRLSRHSTTQAAPPIYMTLQAQNNATTSRMETTTQAYGDLPAIQPQNYARLRQQYSKISFPKNEVNARQEALMSNQKRRDFSECYGLH